MTNSFFSLLEENTRIIEAELEKYIDRDDSYGLSEIMSYSLLSGGKRLRPFIVIEASKLFSNDNFDIKRALPFACALEMVQTYSLIHDDLPCMDNDDYRRGKLTSHKVFGEDKALLAGDSLLTYAFEVLASNQYVSDKIIRYATVCLAKYAGFAGMAGGQMIDLNSDKNIKSYSELKTMHALKTSALIKCAVVLGYLSSIESIDDEIISDLETYAENIGVAFQIRDDILDITATSEELGKPVGSDAKNGKTTSLSFMSIEDANMEIDRLTSEAVSVIKKYYKEPYEHCPLIELAEFMGKRTK